MAKPNSLETARSRDEAILRCQANPKGQEEVYLPGGKPSRVRLPVFSLLTIPAGPTVKMAEVARHAGMEILRK